MKQVLAIFGIGYFLITIASHIEDWRLDQEDAVSSTQHAQMLIKE